MLTYLTHLHLVGHGELRSIRIDGASFIQEFEGCCSRVENDHLLA